MTRLRVHASIVEVLAAWKAPTLCTSVDVGVEKVVGGFWLLVECGAELKVSEGDSEKKQKSELHGLLGPRRGWCLLAQSHARFVRSPKPEQFTDSSKRA